MTSDFHKTISEKPLVSILVITYNSSNYILETLESAKAQTYKNLELVISDDCSSDKTVEICHDWLKLNSKRFVNSQIIRASKNKGIPANINQGLNFVKGEWFKLIAGDDAILIDGIDNYVNAVEEGPEMEILLSQIESYQENFNPKNFLTILPSNWKNIPVLKKEATTDLQIQYILEGFHFPAPGFFIKSSVVKELNGYDEKYTLIEDVPFSLKALLKNKKIFFIPIPTVKYRKHVNNLTSKKGKVFQSYYLQYSTILLKSSKEYKKGKYVLINYWNFFFVNLIFKLGNKGFFCMMLNKIRIYLNPRRVISIFK